MPSHHLHRFFFAFHVTLGVVVLARSLHTALWALPFSTNAEASPHLFLLATVEAVGALLFLSPKTLLAGGALLLATFAVAVTVHAFRGELLGTLLVNAAGTMFVMAHGSVRPFGAQTAPALTGDL
jgi:hypothetical protein